MLTSSRLSQLILRIPQLFGLPSLYYFYLFPLYLKGRETENEISLLWIHHLNAHSHQTAIPNQDTVTQAGCPLQVALTQVRELHLLSLRGHMGRKLE